MKKNELLSPVKKKQGFALMTREQLLTVTSRGGKVSVESRKQDRELELIRSKILEHNP